MAKKSKSTLKKKILIGLLVVAGAASLVGGSYYTWLLNPPKLPKTAAEGLALIGSARYERMPDYRKAEYLDRTAQLMQELRPEEHQELRSDLNPGDLRQFWQQRMMQRVLEFANADPQHRNRLLDEAIAQSGRWRGQHRGRSEGNDEQDRTRRQGVFRSRMQEHIQKGNPQTGALMGEYFRAVRQRRRERGIEDPWRSR